MKSCPCRQRGYNHYNRAGCGKMSTDGACGLATRSRVSTEQLDMLVSFMEEHADFASGKTSVYSRFSASKLWRLLAERLNAAAHDTGGATKSPDKWCRYWADIKYKARKKTIAGGVLGELSNAEERLRAILNNSGSGGSATAGAGARSRCGSEEGAGGEDACSDASCSGLATEELLAEAAMRTALAAEKQAEAVVQGVELLRELVCAVRAGGGLAGVANVAGVGLQPHPDHLANMHHHRL